MHHRRMGCGQARTLAGIFRVRVCAGCSRQSGSHRTAQFTYSVGVLAYALFCGMGYAAFSAIVLFAIGRGVASTKYALPSSVGNIPVVYMTALNGWVHDRCGVSWM